jgi:hypothetical protein
MNDAHFNALAARLYPNYTPQRIQFLRDLRDLLDKYENESGEILGASILFDCNDVNKKEFSWNGEIFN